MISKADITDLGDLFVMVFLKFGLGFEEVVVFVHVLVGLVQVLRVGVHRGRLLLRLQMSVWMSRSWKYHNATQTYHECERDLQTKRTASPNTPDQSYIVGAFSLVLVRQAILVLHTSNQRD